MKPLLALLVISITCLLTACGNAGLHAYQAGNVAFNNHQYKDSLQHYLYAANHNIAAAQYAVGYQYYYGLGTSADIFKSMYWFKQATPRSRRAEYAIQQINAHNEPQPWAVGLHWSDSKK